MPESIDIPPADLETVKDILRHHVPEYEVRAFGSRVTWTAKEYSDLDLAIMTDKPLPISRIANLREAFTESALPIKVDLIDWAAISEGFQKIIEKEYIAVQPKSENLSSKISSGTGWKRVSVEEIASRISMGPFGSDIKTENFVPAGIPIIRGSNLNFGKFVSGKFVFLTKDKANELLNSNSFPWDLVFTHRGTLGQVALVPEEPFERYVVSQSQMKLTCNPEVADAEFLYYFFKSIDGQYALLMNTSQTGVPAIARPVNSLRNIRLLLPPLAEQKLISHILGILDDKIELNKKINATLEAMAQALFKSWFVDFDPVHAKAEGRDTGLPKEIADLFPSEFEDSELGDIPKGWLIGKLGDILLQRIERCLPSAEITDRPYIPIECISSKSLSLLETKSGKEAQSSLTKFYKKDLIFGAMRPYFHKVCIAPFEGITRTTAFVLYPRDKDDHSFATIMLYHPDTIDFATRHSTGSTIPYAVWKNSLQEMPIIIPSSSLRKIFNGIVFPFLNTISDSIFQNQPLIDLRNALLPKLISGQLKVSSK